MFLLVSVRHVGAHPGEHQHGISIQISISLGKTFLRISRIRHIPLTWIYARGFVYVPPFIFQIVDFIYWKVLNFSLIYFEWHDTENQQSIDISSNPRSTIALHISQHINRESTNSVDWYSTEGCTNYTTSSFNTIITVYFSKITKLVLIRYWTSVVLKWNGTIVQNSSLIRENLV